MRIVVFLGAPGSGKGTQAKKIVEKLDAIQLSTGDILRKEIKENSDLGIQAKAYIEKGELLPDKLMIALISTFLNKISKETIIILDGFPRTLVQAEALDKIPFIRPQKAIYFSLEDKFLVQRLSGRRVCQTCGESYHVLFIKPKREDFCDKCSGDLKQRPDDKEEIVHKRLEVFHTQTKNILKYYQETNRLETISVNASVEDVFSELKNLITRIVWP